MTGKVDSRAMREVNRSILLDMIRRGGRISRTDLARRSSLTKPTVSAIVEDLINAGVVQEVGLGKAVSSGGRRARMLQFNEASAAYLGLRFGVHHTRIALADARGEIRVRRDFESTLGDPERLIAQAVAMLDEVFEDGNVPRVRLQAVGVAVPGLVDGATGTCVLAPNLGWENVAVREILSEKLGVPIVVQNVTTCGAIAEGRTGAAAEYRSFVWVGVGSGIGAGIVLDERPFLGRKGFSGEVGHCKVVDDGPLCTCGSRGCLETVASGRALELQAQQALDDGVDTELSKLDHAPTARDITAAALNGDALCRSLLEKAGGYLGKGIALMQNILNPEIVVLGGQLLEADELLLDAVRRSASKHALKAEQVQVVQSTLKEHAIITGAVLLAMDQAVRSYRIVDTNSPIVVG
jgi:predicted NBD/HSP70 family sugar kinase